MDRSTISVRPMPCVFCNKPTADEVLIDFEAKEAVGTLCPRHLSMLNDGTPTRETVDGDQRPVCVRSNCTDQPRYGVVSGDSVSELARTGIDLDRVPDPVLCQRHYDALR